MLPVLLFLFCFCMSTDAIPIDNGVVGEPSVQCETAQIRVDFSVRNAFQGRIFAKGASKEPNCVVRGRGEITPSFAVGTTLQDCGVRRLREVGPKGMTIMITIVISFHPLFLTKVDRAYNIRCFFMEKVETVAQQLDVSMITTEDVTGSLEVPTCRYEILRSDINGTPVRYAKIGDPVYHKWTCESERGMYCMRVHSCKVDDGSQSSSSLIVDENGCATDRYLLQNLEYLSDLMAGQEAHVFQFADRAQVFFNCQIQLTVKEGASCAAAVPDCGQPSSARNKREVNATAGDSRSDVETIANFDLPPQKINVLFDLGDEPDPSHGERDGIHFAPIFDDSSVPFLPPRNSILCWDATTFYALCTSFGIITICPLIALLFAYWKVHRKLSNKLY